IGVSPDQPLLGSSTFTMVWRAWPSLAGTGPRTLPVTYLTLANRWASPAALAWSAAVMGAPARSYTMRAGRVSVGRNLAVAFSTLVDSAFFGSQAEVSFFCAELSLPASGAAAKSRSTQKASTNHFVRRPQGH